MGTRELTLTLPDDVADQLRTGGVDDVSAYLGEAIQHQVRREAIRGYLDECEAAGLPPLTDGDLAEFRRLVGEAAE